MELLNPEVANLRAASLTLRIGYYFLYPINDKSLYVCFQSPDFLGDL